MMVLRLAEVPYEYFLRLKEETLKRIPDYHTNPYVGELVTDLNKIILGLLDIPVGKEELTMICNTLRVHVQSGVLRM